MSASTDPTGAGPPSVAVVTMTRDEGPMLRRWVDFYAAAVGRENLLVFDDHSTDGSTDGLDVAVHRLPGLPGAPHHQAAWLGLCNGVAAGLLATHDVVIHTDVDEFLVPDPDHFAGLPDYLAARRDRDVLAPMTLNVLHHVHHEDDLDNSRPVLDQRRFAKFVPLMCKPSIKRVPATWGYASHGIAHPFRIDPQLFMLHLKFADRRTLRRIADLRHADVAADSRAKNSSWKLTGDEITGQLESFVDDRPPRNVPVFRPRPVKLRNALRRLDNGYTRSYGRRQIDAMRTQPLVRIPPRLRGTL